MLNTIHSRFGRGPARLFAVPAVLATVGVAVVSLATGASAFGNITLSAALPSQCPATNAIACGQAQQQARTMLRPVGPVVTAPHVGQLMPGAAISPAVRARIAALRAQYASAAGFQSTTPNGQASGH